jgi:hypothetical protein
MQKIGRNDPCLCGSGKKYKKCCEYPTKLKQLRAQLIPSATPTQDKGASKIASQFFKKQPLN